MPSSWTDQILAVLDHVQAHLDDELSPEMLAQVSGFSLHHFHRVFRGMMDESVMEYVRRLRLDRAALRLKHSDSDVTAVAFAAGYGSHEAFSRAFKAHFGMPPRDYRERQRPRPEAVAFRLREEPEIQALACVHLGDYANSGLAWGSLMEVVQRGSLPFVAAPRALVYDDPEVTAPARCRLDACWPVRPGTALPQLPSGFALRTIPGGQYALTEHRGSYASIGASYVNLLGLALPRRSLELADEPAVEVYLNAPGQVPEEELRTEVCVRVKGGTTA